MTQERVMAQVQTRLQHCLEQRDRPGILTLTTWLVHRHGHPLLQQLLSQPEWASHRPWWEEQISHPNDDRTEDRIPPEPQAQDELHLDGYGAHPANPTESPDQTRDDVTLTPAQVTKQRLKMDKSAKFPKPVPIQEQERTAPTVTPATPKEQQQKRPPNRRHHSLHLRSWLPCSRLPHQDPRQDAA